MTIAKEVIEQVKRTDLAALVTAKGIALKKNGKSWFGLCPFHADKNPSLSINPIKNLFQCFGCGAAGDAIRFVELFDQVDFKEAVKRLSGNGFKKTASRPPAEKEALIEKLGDRRMVLKDAKSDKGLEYKKKKKSRPPLRLRPEKRVINCIMVEGTPTYRKPVSNPAFLVTIRY
jgi:DNA primase